MAQAVSEMEQVGYVERRPHPRDRRARVVFLTGRGQAVQPVAIAAGLHVEARWARLISRTTWTRSRACFASS
jgi:DNA-binding MarR family transcriptional regulator